MTSMSQAPTTGRPASTVGQLRQIVTHPAFRLGFLDAQNGRPIRHDDILERIERETPSRALERLGWFGGAGIFDRPRICEIAQYRYEEGRLAVRTFGIKCKAWGHPDYPPAQVERMIHKLADERGSHQ